MLHGREGLRQALRGHPYEPGMSGLRSPNVSSSSLAAAGRSNTFPGSGSGSQYTANVRFKTVEPSAPPYFTGRAIQEQ